MTDLATTTDLPAAAVPQAHPSLDLISDPISVHNPDEAFEDPGTGTLRAMGTGNAAAGGGEPWMREGVAGDEERMGPEGARTLFYPKPEEPAGPEAVPESRLPEAGNAEQPPGEEGKILSAFARLGDRSVEEAHAQRRFAHGSGPLAEPAPAFKPPEAEDALPPEETFPGEDAPPVPAWLWVLIALAGSGLVVLSAYFGLMHGR